MFIRAILLGLVGVLGITDSRALGRQNIERPLVLSALTGLVLGHLQQGVMIGASLELLAMGMVGIGAASPPDINLGSILATAFTILSGATTETALTLAIPIAVLGQLLGILVRVFLVQFGHWADREIDRGNFRKAQRIHIVYSLLLFQLSYFIPIFLAIYFGTDLVRDIVALIPAWVTGGLNLAGKILPAMGFAMLLNTMLSKSMSPWLFLGFILVAYSGIGMVGVALIAVVLAFLFAEAKFSRAGE